MVSSMRCFFHSWDDDPYDPQRPACFRWWWKAPVSAAKLLRAWWPTTGSWRRSRRAPCCWQWCVAVAPRGRTLRTMRPGLWWWWGCLFQAWTPKWSWAQIESFFWGGRIVLGCFGGTSAFVELTDWLVDSIRAFYLKYGFIHASHHTTYIYCVYIYIVIENDYFSPLPRFW